MVLLDENTFVFGGSYPKNKKLTATALLLVLDLKTNKWVRATNMPKAKTTRAVVKDDFIYVIGGYDGNFSLNVFERFDPKNNH